MSEPTDYQQALMAVNDAVQQLLAPGEISVAWVLAIDVVGPGATRYLANRHGGGAQGLDTPTLWTQLGMLRASANAVEGQLERQTFEVLTDPDEDDDEDE